MYSNFSFDLASQMNPLYVFDFDTCLLLPLNLIAIKIFHRLMKGCFHFMVLIIWSFLYLCSYSHKAFLLLFIFLQTTATQGVLFDHLVNIWEFNPGPAPGTCDLHFLVDFKFQSPLYGQVRLLISKMRNLLFILIKWFYHRHTSNKSAIYFIPSCHKSSLVLEKPYKL